MSWIRLFFFVFLLLSINIGIISCNYNRSQITSIPGIVSSATPEATMAGEQILKNGGNAIDAAVAVAFALGVTESAMSGLGGGIQVLLSVENGTPVAVNGTTFSPSATPPGLEDTLTFHRRSTVPSSVKTLDFIFRNYGSGNVTWQQLLSPAIELAEKGYKVGPYRAKVYERHKEALEAEKFNTGFFLTGEGKVPGPGDKIVQKTLAKTLRRIAKKGAGEFYHGETAKAIHKDMAANGGWISYDDLKNFPEPAVYTPLSVNIGEFQIYTQPPPCGGWVSLLAHNILESLNGNALDNNDLAETLYLSHRERKQHPVVRLHDFENEISQKLAKSRATEIITSNELRQISPEHTGGETTHFSVTDNDGNAIAVTASINAYFGAMAASDELGFLYNTYMDDFVFGDDSHPFAVRPGAMAYSSMTPTIVQKGGKNVLVIGSPGSSRIISSVFQITAKWMKYPDIERHVKAPRVHVSDEKVYLENLEDTARVSKALIEKYSLSFGIPKNDLSLHEDLNPYYGGVHAIAFENGKWTGVADLRRDGKATPVQ